MQSKLDATQEMFVGLSIVSIGRCPFFLLLSAFLLGSLYVSLPLSLCQFRTPFFLLARLCFLELMKKVKGEIEEDWEGRCWDGYDVCVQQYLCFLRKEKPIYFGYNGGTVKRRWVWNKETVSCCCWWIAKSKERVYSFGLFCGCWLKGGSEKWEWVLKGQCERERV